MGGGRWGWAANNGNKTKAESLEGVQRDAADGGSGNVDRRLAPARWPGQVGIRLGPADVYLRMSVAIRPCSAEWAGHRLGWAGLAGLGMG